MEMLEVFDQYEGIMVPDRLGTILQTVALALSNAGLMPVKSVPLVFGIAMFLFLVVLSILPRFVRLLSLVVMIVCFWPAYLTVLILIAFLIVTILPSGVRSEVASAYDVNGPLSVVMAMTCIAAGFLYHQDYPAVYLWITVGVGLLAAATALAPMLAQHGSYSYAQSLANVFFYVGIIILVVAFGTMYRVDPWRWCYKIQCSWAGARTEAMMEKCITAKIELSERNFIIFGDIPIVAEEDKERRMQGWLEINRLKAEAEERQALVEARMKIPSWQERFLGRFFGSSGDIPRKEEERIIRKTEGLVFGDLLDTLTVDVIGLGKTWLTQKAPFEHLVVETIAAFFQRFITAFWWMYLLMGVSTENLFVHFVAELSRSVVTKEMPLRQEETPLMAYIVGTWCPGNAAMLISFTWWLGMHFFEVHPFLAVGGGLLAVVSWFLFFGNSVRSQAHNYIVNRNNVIGQALVAQMPADQREAMFGWAKMTGTTLFVMMVTWRMFVHPGWYCLVTGSSSIALMAYFFTLSKGEKKTGLRCDVMLLLTGLTCCNLPAIILGTLSIWGLIEDGVHRFYSMRAVQSAPVVTRDVV